MTAGVVEGDPVMGSREASGQTGLTTRSCPWYPEASRWFPLLPPSMSHALWWSTWPGCWPLTAASFAPRGAAVRWVVSVRRCWCCAGGATEAAGTAWPADAGVWQATGYRYLPEGIDVLAARAADLHQVLRRCHDEGFTPRDPRRHPDHL